MRVNSHTTIIVLKKENISIAPLNKGEYIGSSPLTVTIFLFNMNFKKKTFFIFLQQFLCRHKWKNISGMPSSNPRPGEMISASRMHKCSKCKKKEMKGMGMYLG